MISKPPAATGEAAPFEGVWDREGYCRVAFLPNVKRNGSVPILSGTGLSTTAAGSEFVTNEEWLRNSRGLLGLALQDRVAYSKCSSESTSSPLWQ